MRIGLSRRLYLLVALFAVGGAALAATLIWMQEQRAWDARARQLQALLSVPKGTLCIYLFSDVLHYGNEILQTSASTAGQARTCGL